MVSISGESDGVNRWNGLRRSPLDQRSRKQPIRQRSAKQQVAYDIRVPIIQEAMERGQLCEACPKIADVDLAQAMRCGVLASDWHEVRTRGRGGSITSAPNRLWVCRPGHDWITTHPIEARSVGLVLNSWDPEPS